MLDDASVAAQPKPKPSPAPIAFGALAGLAFLFMLVETAVSAIAGIRSFTVEYWLYWPIAVAVKELLFILLPMACFALSLFGPKRRRPVFLLLAIAWQAAILVSCIWFIWPSGLAFFLKACLPLILSLACMLFLLARAEKEKAASPPPLAAAGIFAGVFVAYVSLESIFYFAFSPLWGPEGFIPIFWNVIGLALFAPFYIRRKGAVKRFHIVFISLALLFQAYFCGMESFGAVLYAVEGEIELAEALSAVAYAACLIAGMVTALVLAVKARRANRRITQACAPIYGEAFEAFEDQVELTEPEEQEEQEEQVDLNFEEETL